MLRRLRGRRALDEGRVLDDGWARTGRPRGVVQLEVGGALTRARTWVWTRGEAVRRLGGRAQKSPKTQNLQLLRREQAASGGPGRFRGHQGKSQWRTQGWERGFFSLRGDEGHRGVLGLKPAFWHLDLPSAVHQL